MSLVTHENYDHQRGADGFFPPHPDEITRDLISSNAHHISGQLPTMQCLLRDDRMLRWYLIPDEPGMGPRLYWTVSTSMGNVIAAGLFERDLDFEEEHQKLTGTFQV